MPGNSSKMGKCMKTCVLFYDNWLDSFALRNKMGGVRETGLLKTGSSTRNWVSPCVTS